MANVDSELRVIAEGRYGKDVRKAIHDGIFKTNIDVEQNTSDIEELKARPAGGASLILSGTSPLLNGEEKPILGIDVEGKSEQGTSQILECVQGSVTPSVGTKINQSVGSNTTRGVSSVIYLPKDATVIISSGYLIYTMQSSASDGNIESVITWATSFKATTNGWYRFYIRTSVDGGTVTPSAFTLTANDIAPSPTNPIPIVDASGEVKAHTKNLVYEILNGCNVDGNGVVVSGNTYNLAFAKVKKGNTYSLRFGDGISTVYGYFASKPIVGSVSYNNTRTVDTSTSVVAPIDGYIALRCVQSFDKVQIEEGTSASSYVPYASNSITLPTLRSIGSVADELIVNKDGSGKIVQRVIDYTFTSQGIWNTAADGAKYLDKAQDIIGKRFVNDETKVNLLCECLFADTMNNTRKGSNKIATQYVAGYDSCRLWVSPDVNVSDLIGKTLYLIAETPIETPLTAEQVASILALKTYEGTTIIDSELDIINVDYSGDLKAYIDAKTNYSYEEKLIGKWVDGKDLYQIVKRVKVDSMYIQMVPINGEYVNVKSAMGTVGNCILPYDYNYAYAKILINEDMGYTYFTVQVSSSFDNQIAEIIFTYTKNDTAPAAISALSLDETEGE